MSQKMASIFRQPPQNTVWPNFNPPPQKKKQQNLQELPC